MLPLLLQDPLLLMTNKQYPSMTKFIHWRNTYKLKHASYSETKSFCKNGVNYHLTWIATSGPLKKTKKLQNQVIWDKQLKLGISVSRTSSQFLLIWKIISIFCIQKERKHKIRSYERQMDFIALRYPMTVEYGTEHLDLLYMKKGYGAYNHFK